MSTSGRFSIIPARAVDDNRLEPAALLVLVALGTYSDRDGYCWPSQQLIADRIGVSRQAVGRQITILQKLGYIVIKRMWDKDAKKTHNAYKILFDTELPAGAEARCEKKQETDATSNVATPPTDATWEAETDATSRGCTNVPGTTQLNTQGGEMQSDDYKARIVAAVQKFHTDNAGKADVSRYPEEVQETIRQFCWLWHMDVPRMRKGKNGEAADWINGAREINDACGEFGLDLLRLYAEEFEKYKAEHEGLAPYRVTRPASIVKSLRGLAAEVRSNGLAVGGEPKTIVLE